MSPKTKIRGQIFCPIVLYLLVLSLREKVPNFQYDLEDSYMWPQPLFSVHFLPFPTCNRHTKVTAFFLNMPCFFFFFTLTHLWIQCSLCLNNRFLFSASGKCLVFFQDSYSQCNSSSWYLSSSKRLICLFFCNSTDVCMNICFNISHNELNYLFTFSSDFPTGCKCPEHNDICKACILSLFLLLVQTTIPDT